MSHVDEIGMAEAVPVVPGDMPLGLALTIIIDYITLDLGYFELTNWITPTITDSEILL